MKLTKKNPHDDRLDQNIKVTATFEKEFYIDLEHLKQYIEGEIPMFQDDEHVVRFFEERESEIAGETGDGIACYLFDDIMMSITADDFDFDITLEAE